MGGVNVEEIANEHVAWRARDRLKMRRVFHDASPPGALQAAPVCGGQDVGSSRERDEELARGGQDCWLAVRRAEPIFYIFSNQAGIHVPGARSSQSKLRREGMQPHEELSSAL